MKTPYYEIVEAAHTAASHRDNLSTQVLKASWAVTPHWQNRLIRMRYAILTAVNTLDTLHAPVALTREYFFHRGAGPITSGEFVFGWGSSFEKGCADPILSPCHKYLETFNPATHNNIEIVTGLLHKIGKMLYPNLSLYTAVLAQEMDWPKGFEILLTGALRAKGWQEILEPK